MSNPNGVLSQKLCQYLNEGRTFGDILTPEGPTLKQNLSITDNAVTRVFEVSEIQARNQGDERRRTTRTTSLH